MPSVTERINDWVALRAERYARAHGLVWPRRTLVEQLHDDARRRLDEYGAQTREDRADLIRPTWIVSDIDTAAGRISMRALRDDIDPDGFEERVRSWSNTILAPYNSFPLGRLGGSWDDWHKLWGLVGQAHEARVFCKEVTYKDGKLTISDYSEAG